MYKNKKNYGGWNDVGFHGDDEISTPNIDALAFAGCILTNCYTMPLCTPSRAALMTGLHPIHTGMQHSVMFASQPYGLPLHFKLLPQYLKDEGYVTHAIGKWHIGSFRANYTPTYRGFDTHFGYWTGRQDYIDHTNIESPYWGYDMRRGLNVSFESHGCYSTDLYTDEALKLIDSHDLTRPMFLYVAHLAVHAGNFYQPLQAPRYVIDKFKHIKDTRRRIFAAMLWKLDESVGKIVAALGKRNMLKNTLIIFTTDNGGPANNYDSSIASNWPLRGTKDTLWEGGVHGVALVWGSMLPKSTVCNHLMHLQDWVPTILNAVNSKQENLNMDGHNLWPVLKKEKSFIYDELLLNDDTLRNMSALRKGDWKIISGEVYGGFYDGWYGPTGRDPEISYNINAVENSYVATTFIKQNIEFPTRQRMLEIRANVTIHCNFDETNVTNCDLRNGTCLFNVSLDPCERNNRADDKPQILNYLEAALNRYEPVPHLNQPSDPRSNPVHWNYAWTNWMDYV